MATAEEFISGAGSRMDKSVEHARNEFNTVRTGRASGGLLDRIMVDYYGTPTPLRQLATINVPEPRLLTIQPFDPGDREGDSGIGPRPTALERRQADPPAGASAHRGAPEGAREGRPAHGRRAPRRRTRGAPRCAQAPARARQER